MHSLAPPPHEPDDLEKVVPRFVKEIGFEERGGLADDIFIRQGQVPLDLAGEATPDPDSLGDDNAEEEENREGSENSDSNG